MQSRRPDVARDPRDAPRNTCDSLEAQTTSGTLLAMHPQPRETAFSSQLRWFSLIWMMAFATHYIDLAPRHSHLMILAVVAAPMVVMHNPVVPFLAFVVVSSILAVFDMPAPANHMVLALLANAALIGAALMTKPGRDALRGVSAPQESGSGWLEIARVPAALTMVTMYGFALFHKLNWSFLDPAVSCAGEVSALAVKMTGINVPIHGVTVVGLAVATLLVEALIPALLAIPRWRHVGISAGVAFHALLGAAGFVDFSTFACALYVLIAIDVVPHISEGERHRRRAMYAWGAFLLCAALDAASVQLAARHLPGRSQLLFVSWLLGLTLLMTPFLRTLWTKRLRPGDSLLRLHSPWFAVIPVVAFLNGMGPYLGIRTTSTFSMFSNLRVEEGRSNHMIGILSYLEVTPWMHDVVEVSSFEFTTQRDLNLVGRLRGGYTSLANGSRWIDGVHTEPVRLPWLELKRTVLRWKDAGGSGLSVGYRRRGVTHFVADAINDPELAGPLPWWTRWFVAFRDIETRDSVRCRW